MGQGLVWERERLLPVGVGREGWERFWGGS